MPLGPEVLGSLVDDEGEFPQPRHGVVGVVRFYVVRLLFLLGVRSGVQASWSRGLGRTPPAPVAKPSAKGRF